MRFDLRVAVKVFTQCLVDRFVHPVFGLPVAVALVVAVLLRELQEVLDAVPDIGEPVAFGGRAGIHPRTPSRIGHRKEVQRIEEVALGQLCALLVATVALVDRDHVGHLHNAAFDSLQFVPGSCDLDQQEEVDHRMDGRFGLADTDRLDENHVEPGRFAQDNAFARFARHAAERSCRRGGADEDRRVVDELLHAGLVAEDRAAAAFRTGVDSQH